MRGWYWTSLVLAAGSSAPVVYGQDSRPIAETIRIKSVEEAPRRLPSNIVVIAADIVPDLPTLSLPRVDDNPSMLRQVGEQRSIVPPSLEPPPLPSRNALIIPSLESKRAPEGSKEPLLLPTLDAPVLAPSPSSPFPDMPLLDSPSDPVMNSKVHMPPAILPASATVPAARESSPPELLLPGNLSPSAPRVIEKKRRAFWDKEYDPAKDGDRSAIGENQTVVLERNPRSHWWLEADYLHWYTKRSQTPTLLYGGIPSVLSTPADPQIGRIFPLYSSLDRQGRTTSGLSLSLGTWLEPCYRWGLEFRTLAIFDIGETKSFSSPGDVYLLRPFRDLATNTPALAQLAGAGTTSGSVQIETSQRLVSDEIHFLYALRDVPQGGSSMTSLNLLFGYRHIEFREHLNIGDQSISQFDGSSIATNDHFATWTDFHAGQIGLKANYQIAKWSLDLTGKIALGGATQNVTIRGNTQTSSALFGTQTSPGGFYAQPTNIGEFQRQRLVYAPEAGLRLSYQFAPNLVGSVGYNFLYISSVMRATDQIDTGLNFSSTGPARPAFRWKEDDLWAQGLSLGLTFQY